MTDEQQCRHTLRRSSKGATAIAYALLVGLIGVVAIGALTSIGSSVDEVLTRSGGEIGVVVTNNPDCLQAGSESFDFTGAIQSFAVDNRIAKCSFAITVTGAGGGGGRINGGEGGSGASISFAFSPDGQTGQFSMLVGEGGVFYEQRTVYGGGGAPGTPIGSPEEEWEASGSGGGASGLRWQPSSGPALLMAVAGGGGGGADSGPPGNDGTPNGADGAGDACCDSYGGDASITQSNGSGGAADVSEGSHAGAGGSSNAATLSAQGGGNGNNNPGSGGAAYPQYAISGGGGAGHGCRDSGAGGGGGYGGGGGGACTGGDGNAGGGGGSYADPSLSASMSLAGNGGEWELPGGNGAVIISWQ